VPVLKDGTPLKRGTFVVASMLGRGGFGEVYLARQPRMDRDVAIKVLNPNLSDDAGVVERFQREALAAASLRHPNVLPVFDFDLDEDAGVWFLAMQYIPGGRTLKERLGAPMPPEEVARFLAGVAGALDAAHARGIVHRDVKPANVLMDGDHPQLADFGIAHLGDLTGITATGMAIGTPVYMSPEQAMGKPVGPAADQYSLAVMAFEMLAGRPPFLGDSMSLVMQHVNAVPPAVSEYNASAAVAAAAVARGLSKNPADRFPTCVEFIQAIVPGMALFVTPSGPSAVVPGGYANAQSGVAPAAGASAAVDASTAVPDEYLSGATVESQPGVDVPAQDSRVDAIRRAETAKPALPLPMPVLAGGGVALVVGVLAIIFAMRVIGPGAGPSDGGATPTTPGGIITAASPPPAAPTAAPAIGALAPGQGRVNVDSNPIGALILLDGVVQVPTPRGFNLDAGDYEFRLQFQSYEDFVATVKVEDGKTQTISPALSPKPPVEVLEVSDLKIGRDPYRDSFGLIRIQEPTTTFRIQDDINAIVYVKPKSKGIRDVSFTTTVRWQLPGTLDPLLRLGEYQISKDSDEEFIRACAPASAIDAQASNTPLTVEFLIDGARIASFDFRVSGGSVALRGASPCDETVIRGPIASVPGVVQLLAAS